VFVDGCRAPIDVYGRFAYGAALHKKSGRFDVAAF